MKTRLTTTALLTLLLAMAGSLALGQNSGLSSLTGNHRPEPLPLEQAFPLYLSAVDGNSWQLTWTPATGHYLYRHAFAVSLQNTPDVEPVPVAIDIPEGLHKTDQFFGEIQAYYGGINITVAPDQAVSEQAVLWVEYQGCADWGFCYPPQRTALPLYP